MKLNIDLDRQVQKLIAEKVAFISVLRDSDPAGSVETLHNELAIIRKFYTFRNSDFQKIEMVIKLFVSDPRANYPCANG